MADRVTVTVSPATIAKYAPIARRIALGFVKRLPRHVLPEDVQQAALVGLFDALRRGQDTTHPTFEYYARQRIRGAIMDELRAQDWLPRRTRGNPDRALHVTLVRLEDTVRPGESWDDRIPAPGPTPEERAATAERYAQALAAPMSARHRYVVTMTEKRGLKFKDVGRMLGVSEPRISQLHAAAFESMRRHLTETESEEIQHEHTNVRGLDRAARGRESGHTRARPDPARVRASGVGPEASRPVARAVPRGGRLIRLDDHAPSPGLGRAQQATGLDMAPAGGRSGSVSPGVVQCPAVLA